MRIPSAAVNLTNRTHRKLLIAVVFLVAGLIAQGVIMNAAYQEALTATTEIQEKLNASISTEGLEKAQAIIHANPEGSDKLLYLFPNATTFPNVIAQLESLISLFDPNGLVQTQANNPVKTANELSIPINLILQATIKEMEELLLALEQLPYIVEVISIDNQSSDGHRDRMNIKIGVRVYVQDPFTKTNPN